MTSVSATVPQIDRSSPSPAEESIIATTHGPNHPVEALERETERDMGTSLDGGKTAWLVLAACSLIQLPVWGYSIAFGVIQEYYDSPASGIISDRGSVAIIGTTATGILYLSSPLTFTLLTLRPSLRHWFGPIGLAITSASFVASAFFSRVSQLIALQGVLAALGTGLLFATSTLCLDELFARRKGLAYGIMWAGKSATGVGLPFAAAAALDRFGHRTTMLAWAVLVTAITAPLLVVLRPHKASSSPAAPASSTTASPEDDDDGPSSSPSSSIYKSPSFWALQTGNVLQSLGYFLPSTYLPSYATRALALPPRAGTLLLALLNTTSVPGGIVLGVLCDRPRMTRRVLLLSALPSAVAVLCCWGLAGPQQHHHRQGGNGSGSSNDGNGATGNSHGSGSDSSGVALLVVFALAYGFFAGGFSSTWSGVLRELQSENPRVDTGLVFGLLAGGRGVGNVVSGPISVALMAAKERGGGGGGSGSGSGGGGAGAAVTGSPGGESGGGAAGAYDSEYGPMILFTGASALLGAWGWLCQRRDVASAASSWRSRCCWWTRRAAAALAAVVPLPSASTPRRWSCVGGSGAIVRAVAGAWRRAARRGQRQQQEHPRARRRN